MVKLTLSDGTELVDCNIYPEDAKEGDRPLKDVEEIEKALQRVPWGIKHVSFQNKFINGRVHVNHVNDYEFQ